MEGCKSKTRNPFRKVSVAVSSSCKPGLSKQIRNRYRDLRYSKLFWETDVSMSLYSRAIGYPGMRLQLDQHDAIGIHRKSTEGTSCRQSVCHKGNDSTAGHSRSCIRVKVSNPDKHINRGTKCVIIVISAKHIEMTGLTSEFYYSTVKQQHSNGFKNHMFCCHASSLPLQKRNLQGQAAQ